MLNDHATGRHSRYQHLLVLLLFAGLTLLMTWPVITRLGTHYIGGRDDLWVHQWTFWWIREALQSGISPFYTTLLYYPDGVGLTSHNIAWFNIALWLPLQAFVGRVAAYNLTMLLIFALNAFCTYLFAWSVIRRRLPAVVAGLIFGFWPYTLSHYDHTNMMVVFWVPLTLFFLHRTLHGGRWLDALLTALTLAMIGITRWQLLIMSAPILIAYPAWLLLGRQVRPNRRLVLQLLTAGLLAALLMAPLLTPLVVDQFTRDFPQDVFLDEPQWGRTDLLAYFLPSINNGLWRDRVAPFYDNFVVNKFYTPYLGYTTLFLGTVGLLRRWRRTWVWLLLALLYFMLAIGPELAFNGRSFPQIPMPYRLVEDFFLLRLLRRPDRLNVFLGLPLAMMAGWGMAVLLDRLPSLWTRRAAAVAVILLLLLAYLPVPFATSAPELPSWYQQLNTTDSTFATLDIPVNDREFDKWYMLYQTEHGLPLVTGHVSRLPREALTFVDSVPLLANLQQRDQLPDPRLTNVTAALAPLSQAGVRYLILHKRFANEGLQAVWRDWLSFAPAYEDDELLVFHTAPQYERDFSFAAPLVDGIGVIHANLFTPETVQQGRLQADVRWGTSAAPGGDYTACLQLRDRQDEPAQTYCQPIDPEAPTFDWLPNEIRRSMLSLPLAEDLTPGTYSVALLLAEAGSRETVGDSLVLGAVDVVPFAPETTSGAVWSDSIALPGFTLQQNATALDLTLYWRAANAITTSYKTFVHLTDPATGSIVAQYDAVPRQWQYPTTAWSPGEIVHDPVRLDLAGVPPGRYELRLGWVDELTGERLLLAEPPRAAAQPFLTIAEIEVP